MHSPKKIVELLHKMNWDVVEYKMRYEDLKGNSIPHVKKECFRFLALYATGSGNLCPSQTVDKFWHAMILDTQKYASTAKIFGRFLHHVPNGNKKSDAKLNEKNFWNTIDQYEAVFGEPNLSVWGIEKR